MEKRERHKRKPEGNGGDTAFPHIIVVQDEEKTRCSSFTPHKIHKSSLTATRAGTFPPRDSSLCNPVSRGCCAQRDHAEVTALWADGPRGLPAELSGHPPGPSDPKVWRQQQNYLSRFIWEGGSRERSWSATDPRLLIFMLRRWLMSNKNTQEQFYT